MIPRIDIGTECIVYRTRMASRAMSRAANASLRTLNLQITQFALLVALSQETDEPMSALADKLDVEPSTLLRNLKILEDRGLLIGDGGRGRRGRRLSLTVAGTDLLAAAMPVWAATQARIAEALDGRIAAMREALAILESAALSLQQTSSHPTEIES